MVKGPDEISLADILSFLNSSDPLKLVVNVIGGPVFKLNINSHKN